MRFHQGERVDHYTLLEPLGEGGQGSVWKVLDPRDGGVVRALKLVSLSETGPAAFERARREATILAAARHPSLVTCHGLFEDPRTGIVGLVMDLASGSSLADVALEERFHRGRAQSVLAQLASALAYIHASGLAHRDLKPENVIVTDAFWDEPHRAGTVKLVDFGIAAPTSNPNKLTGTGLVIGTLPYLAPELVDPASWGKADGSSRDLFAFGVLAYQLLFGKHPTRLGPQATMVDYARAYKAAEAGRIAWPPAGLEGVAGASIATCLSLRWADRPTDGAALLKLMRTGAVDTKGPSSSTPGPTSPHRTPAPPPVAARRATSSVEPTVESAHRKNIAPRTEPAAPLTGALMAAPARSSSSAPVEGSSSWRILLGFLLAMLLGGGLVAWVSGWYERFWPKAPSPLPVPTLHEEPRPRPTNKPAPQPLVQPAPPTPPIARPAAPAEVEACRLPNHYYDGSAIYSCPPCTREPSPIPRDVSWWMRIHGVTDPSLKSIDFSAKELCVSVAGSATPPSCTPYNRISPKTGGRARLVVTTEDLESGRVILTIRHPGGVLATGRGVPKSTPVRGSALCASLPLYLDDPEHPDVIVSVNLDNQ